jgi:hypothetical protein
MGLSEIAAGIEVTAEQRETGVVTVDDTDASIAERLAPFADDLPCSVEAAAAVLDSYAAGADVGVAADTAGLPAVTAAKTLHLLGESVSPVGETGREVVRDWIAGELSRSEAEELARVSGAEFALAAYVETHEPIEGAGAAVEGLLAARDRPEPLADTMSDVTDLQ